MYMYMYMYMYRSTYYYIVYVHVGHCTANSTVYIHIILWHSNLEQ